MTVNIILSPGGAGHGEILQRSGPGLRLRDNLLLLLVPVLRLLLVSHGHSQTLNDFIPVIAKAACSSTLPPRWVLSWEEEATIAGSKQEG